MSSSSRKPIRLFLSYSSRDRRFCAIQKTSLEKYGATVFLAHQDISPSVEWQNTILRQLNSCDVFIPVLTNNFHGSLWTDQEGGYALARRRYIGPLAVGVMPYGFLGRFQAVKGRRNTPRQNALELFKGLALQKDLRNRLRETIIRVLDDVTNFDDAGDLFTVLATLSPLSERQLNLILKAAASNNQIYGARSVSRPISKIVKENKKRLDKSLWTEFTRVTRLH